MFKIVISAVTYKPDASDVSIYIENVVRELSRENLVYVLIPRRLRDLFPVQNENVFFVTYIDLLFSPVLGWFWQLFILPFCINYKKFDFAIIPEASQSLFCRYPIFTIAVVHQVLDKARFNAFGSVKRFVMKRCIPRFLMKANVVMCPSQTTHDKVVELLKISGSKVKVNLPGYDHVDFNDRIIVDKGALKAEYGLKNEFVLYVADIEYPRNNHINLIKAYDRLPDQVKQHFDLVFVGHGGVGADVVYQYAKHSDYSAHIKFLPKIPKKYIPAMYKMATLYVHASTENDFGYPVIRAMACGTAVICSATPALCEVGGDAIHSCAPTDFEDLSMHMDAVLNYPSEQEDMGNRGLIEVQRFNWRSHCQSLIDYFLENNSCVWSERFREKRNSDERELAHPGRRCKANMLLFPFVFTGLMIEKCIALFFLLFWALPWGCVLFCRKLIFGTAIFKEVTIFGRRKEPEKVRYFNSGRFYIANAALLWLVLRNRLSLVGVSIREYDPDLLNSGMAYIYNQKPGVFNQWFITDSFKDPDFDRDEVEWDYLGKQGLFRNLIIIIRSLSATMRHIQWSRCRGEIAFGGVEMVNASRAKLAEVVLCAARRREKRSMTFLNAKRLNLALHNDDDYLRDIRQINYRIPYGGALGFLAQLQGRPLVDHVSSAELLPVLCSVAQDNNLKIYLVGGRLGVAPKMMAALGREYPDLNVIGENSASAANLKDMEGLKARIDELRPDIILVSMETPDQERWIARYAPQLPCPVVIGVGDLFEICSGNIRRVPGLLRTLGFEWVVRSMREKGMAKRFCFQSPFFVVRTFVRSLKGK